MSLWSWGWRIDPTSVLPTGMPLSSITRDTVVIFSGHVKTQTMLTADRADWGFFFFNVSFLFINFFYSNFSSLWYFRKKRKEKVVLVYKGDVLLKNCAGFGVPCVKSVPVSISRKGELCTIISIFLVVLFPRMKRPGVTVCVVVQIHVSLAINVYTINTDSRYPASSSRQ